MINLSAVFCFPANCTTNSCTSTQGPASVVGKGSPVAWAQPLTTAAQDSQFYLSSAARGVLLLSASANTTLTGRGHTCNRLSKAEKHLEFQNTEYRFSGISVSFFVFVFLIYKNIFKKNPWNRPHIYTKGGRKKKVYKSMSTLWKVKTFKHPKQTREQKESL